MTKFEFKPEDFRGLCWGITSPAQFKQVVSERANEKIAPLLARSNELEKMIEDAPTVFRRELPDGPPVWTYAVSSNGKETLTARLVMIEEIK